MTTTTIAKLEIANITVFEEQVFEFCSGVNVVIGENGAGKSHLLKAIYCAFHYLWQLGNASADDKGEYEFGNKLKNVFSNRQININDLFRKANERAAIAIDYVGPMDGHVIAAANPLAKNGFIINFTANRPKVEEPVFIPSGDVLSQYKGLMYNYERKYETRDELYRDICSALSGAGVVSLAGDLGSIVAKLEGIIGGVVEFKDDDFFIKSGKKSLIVTLAAEGHRKLAMLAHLIKNGTIREGSILFWDEPETNLNPKLIVEAVGIIRELAAAGVQVFVATHDYLVTYELGMAVKYETPPKVPVKFFALYKQGKEKNSPTVHESSNDVSGLQNNAILDEFAAHYDRETALFAKSFRGEK